MHISCHSTSFADVNMNVTHEFSFILRFCFFFQFSSFFSFMKFTTKNVNVYFVSFLTSKQQPNLFLFLCIKIIIIMLSLLILLFLFLFQLINLNAVILFFLSISPVQIKLKWLLINYYYHC